MLLRHTGNGLFNATYKREARIRYQTCVDSLPCSATEQVSQLIREASERSAAELFDQFLEVHAVLTQQIRMLAGIDLSR